MSAVRSPCSVSPSTAETSPPPRSRAWKRARSPPQRCGAGLCDERNRGGEGDSRLGASASCASAAGQARSCSRAAPAPMPSPHEGCIRTADRPGEGEHGDVDERPGEQAMSAAEATTRSKKKGGLSGSSLWRTKRPKFRAESDIRSRRRPPKEGDARREDESEEEARHRDPGTEEPARLAHRIPGRRRRRARRQRAARVDRTGRAEGDLPDDHRLERVPVEPQLPRTCDCGRDRPEDTASRTRGGRRRWRGPGGTADRTSPRSIPSPNRHSTPLGRPSGDRLSSKRNSQLDLGAGRQNQAVAPVRPVERGDVWMRPGESAAPRPRRRSPRIERRPPSAADPRAW